MKQQHEQQDRSYSVFATAAAVGLIGLIAVAVIEALPGRAVTVAWPFLVFASPALYLFLRNRSAPR